MQTLRYQSASSKGVPLILFLKIVIENAKMVMATSDCYVIRWNLDDALEPEGLCTHSVFFL